MSVASIPALRPWPTWWCAVAVFVVAFLVYGPALHGTLIWDDSGHITRPELRSLTGLWRIWFEIGATQQYYPVLHSAFWLQHQFFGDATLGYHIVNVLLHATAACLFAAVLRKWTLPGAWLAAFLFVLHPVCVESVAWISEQKNTLSTVFYLLALLAYLRFDRTRGLVHYVAATFLFLLALGSKTVSASLPAAILVIFWWQRGRLGFRREVAPLIPWFAVAAMAGIFTAWVEHAFINKGIDEFDLGPVERVLLASRAIWFYLGKLLFPVDLSFVYSRWKIEADVWWQYLFLLGMVLAISAGWRWRRRRGVVAAGLFFVGSLFPALGFVNVYPFVFSFVADHFQYLASLGIFALAGVGLAAARARWPAPWSAAAGLGLFAALGVLTWRQSATYRNEFTLYESTLTKNPSASLAHNNLSNALVDAGRATEAIPHLEAVIKLRPDSAKAENNLGQVLLDMRDPAAAVPHLERAVNLQPSYLTARNNLGLALMRLGRTEAAEAQFEAALKIKNDYPEAHLNLGLMLGRRENTAAAIEHFQTAARLLPRNPEPELNWAIALVVSQRTSESFPHFERAVQLAPKRADIENLFARALVAGGQLEGAILHYRRAIELAPKFAEAHFNLAEALRQTGRNDEASLHLAEANRLGWKK